MSTPDNQIIKVCKWAKQKGLIAEADTAVIFYSVDVFKHILSAVKTGFFNANQSLAIKTNPSPSVLKLAVEEGFALEAASIEEVRLAFSNQVGASFVIFDSPVKTRLEISEVSHIPNLLLNANSLEELTRIPSDAVCKVGLRINPLLETDAHGAFAVSTDKSKFGVPISESKSIIQAFLNFPFLSAIHMHIGSGIESYTKHIEGVKIIYRLASEINEQRKKSGLPAISMLDIGGGLKSQKTYEETADFVLNYASALQLEIPELFNHFEIITEFGQLIQAHTSWVVSQVEYVAQKTDSQMAYLHVGADMFTRAVYSDLGDDYQYFAMNHNGDRLERKNTKTSLVGPLCFAGDVLEENILLPELKEGDQLAISKVGANTMGLWSRHCSRQIPKVIFYSLAKNEVFISQERTSIT